MPLPWKKMNLNAVMMMSNTTITALQLAQAFKRLTKTTMAVMIQWLRMLLLARATINTTLYCLLAVKKVIQVLLVSGVISSNQGTRTQANKRRKGVKRVPNGSEKSMQAREKKALILVLLIEKTADYSCLLRL